MHVRVEGGGAEELSSRCSTSISFWNYNCLTRRYAEYMRHRTLSPLSLYFLQDLPAGMHVQQAHVPVVHKRPSRATRTSLLFIWRTANRGKILPHCTATSQCLHARLRRAGVYSSDTCATVCVDDSDWSVLGVGLNVGDSDWLGFPGNFNFLI